MTTLDEVLATKTKAEILEQFLADASILEMDVRGMQPTRFARAYFEIESASHEEWQATRKLIVEGGYLDSASGGWLTLLAAGFFQIDRVPAVPTVGKLFLQDVASAGPATINVGERHAVSNDGKQFYTNTEAGTVALNGNLFLSFKCDVAGASGNVANGQITQLTTPIPGITVSNPGDSTGTWITTSGKDEESDVSLRQRCRNRWSSLGAGGNAAAYAFWVTEAFTSINEAATVTRINIDASNPFGPGSIGVYLANTSGPATPTEIATVDAYLQERKSLGSGELRVVAATAYNQAIVAQVFATGNANYVADSVTALEEYAQTFGVGGTIYRSKLIETLMDVSGVYNVIVTTPATDVVMPASSVLVLSPPPVIS